MMSASSTVRVTHRFNMPAERVFDAWITPAIASRFFFATRTGSMLHCEINPVVGGGFTVTDRRPNADGDESFFEAQHRGTYVELDRPGRLAFDFSVDPLGAVTTRVTIDVVPMGANLCDLVLTHDLGWGETAKANAERSRIGWQRMLEQLDKILGKRVLL